MKPRPQTEREGTCNKKKLPYIISKQQLLQLLLVIKDKRYAMIVFMGSFQGLRIGEMLRLRWADVDLEHGELKVVDGKNSVVWK